MAWVFFVASAAVPACSAMREVTVICLESDRTACRIARNFPASAEQTLTNECTNAAGSIALACPTAGLAGCCNDFPAAYSDVLEACYYAGDAAVHNKARGSGTWSTTP